MPAQSSPQSSATYSQWVSRMLSRMPPNREALVGLFESSVPEPVDLLAQLVGSSFGDAPTPRYKSAFAGGNPYVKAQLAKNYGVDESSIVTTTGATGALSLIYRALLKPGDRVLVENPGFDLFAVLAETNGFGVDRFERKGAGFVVDPAVLEAAIRPDTRIVVVSNLHNPSGFPIHGSILRDLADIAERRDVFVIVDEVYLPYAGAQAKSAVQLGLSPRVLCVNSLTKIYGLSTLRCGWIVGDPGVVRPIHALARETEFSISKLSHAIAALVLEDPSDFMARTDRIIGAARPVIESFHRNWLSGGLVHGALPDHGCIAFPRLVGIDDTKDFSQWLADRGGVIVAPGEYFGAPGHVRIGFGMAPDRLREGLRLLTEGMIDYRKLHGTAPAGRVAP